MDIREKLFMLKIEDTLLSTSEANVSRNKTLGQLSVLYSKPFYSVVFSWLQTELFPDLPKVGICV